MTLHLPQPDGHAEKRYREISHRAQGCLWARVQLTDTVFDSDILLWDNSGKNDLNF